MRTEPPPTPAESPLRRKGGIIRAAIGWAVAAGLTVGLIVVARSELTHLSTLRELASPRLALAGVLILLNLTVGALFTAEVLPVFGVRLRTWEWFCLGMATTLGNYIAPLHGGAGLRGGYLWARHGLSVRHFASGMAGLVVVVLWVTSAAAGMGLVLIYLRHGVTHAALCAIAVVGLVGSSLMGLLPHRLARPTNRWLAQLVDVVNGWHDIVRHPRLLARLAGLAMLNRLLESAAFLLVFQAMGVNVGFWAVLTVTSLGLFSGIISITPGALGVYETGIVLVGLACGIATRDAVVAALTIRLLAFGWLAILGPLGSAILAATLRGQAKVTNPLST